MPDDPSAALVDALRRRLEADGGEPVEAIETHISRVLLAGDMAYKVKKPVRLPFLDFSTLEARRRFCHDELRLNRRLAPALYLDVVDIHGPADAPSFGGDGPVVEVALRMRRFAPGALLSERLAAGTLEPAQLDRLALRLAAFHRDAPPAPRPSPYGSAPLITTQAHAAFEAACGGRDDCATLGAWMQAQAHALAPVWEQRRRDGFVRECHGDLHLANAVVLDDGPTAFDCIEFDLALRFIDIQSDMAFLAMDLMAHGRPDLAWRCLNGWLDATGDHEGLPVLRWYLVYRALVRAEVALLRGAEADADTYRRLARRLSAHDDARLLVTHGLPGAGKSFVSQRISQVAGAVWLRSDVERKRLFGLDVLDRSSTAAVYAPGATARTYGRLRDLARTALRAGHPTIVDAAFLRRHERDAFRALARELPVPFTILDCQAPLDVLRERVRARQRRRDDPSEADEAVLERLHAAQEPLADDEAAVALRVPAAGEADAGALTAAWRRAGLDLDRHAGPPARDHPWHGPLTENAMYRKILVPVDGSPTSELGLQEAIRLAGLTGARLRLLHVIDVLSLAIAGEGYAGTSADLLAAVREGGEDIVRRARGTVEAAGLTVDTALHENTAGRVSELVSEEAARWGADLIVLGTHGRRGVGRLMLGSDAEQIIRLAPVPVLLVRDKAATAARR
jgi:hypothetical protein